MKPEWRRYAPIGLYVALLALLVSAVLLILERQWNLRLQISLALVIIGLAAFAALDPDRVRTSLTGRQARYGSNALVITLAFLGILVVVNYLVYKNPKRWDLTENNQHTLAPETLDTLKSMPEPVTALAFYPSGVSNEQAKRLLDDYAYYGGDQFSYQFIDPVADPVAARNANVAVEASGTIVLKMGDRQEKVTSPTEQQMTGAMVRLLSEKQNLYFLTGHGEYSPEDSGDQSLSEAKKTLEAKNYTVQMLNLLADQTIPADAQVIVIAGPRKPLNEEEVTLIDGFLKSGGALVVLEEPLPLTDYGDQPDPLANYLAENWGIQFGKDVVVDLSSQQPFLAYAAEYNSEHAITSKMQRLGTAFPTARSVTKAGDHENVLIDELIFTASQSWAETNLAGLEAQEQPQPDEGQDIIGRVPLMVTAEDQSTRARIVAIGDADFSIDVNFSYLGNGDLLINSIDWATEQENLINLTPKETTNRILLQPKTMTTGLIWLGAVLVPAALVLVAGIVVAVQRRKRG